MSAETITAGQRRISLDQAMGLALEHQAAGRLQQAEQLAAQILKVAPRHAGAWHLLAVLANSVGRHAEAVDLVTRAIKSNPTVAAFYANRGEMRRLAGDLDGAIADAEQALRMEPGLAHAHSNLGIAWYHKGETDKAEACQKAALRHAPGYAQALNNLGSIQRDRKNLPGAEELYRKAVKSNPGYLEAANNLGAVLTELERPDQALEVLLAALRQNPRYAEVHCNIGNAFVAAEDWERAKTGFTKAIELRPDHPEAYSGLARVSLELRDAEQAHALAVKALELDPHRAESHALLASILSEQGWPDAATASYQRALEIKPSLVNAHLGLGHLHLESGKSAEAAAAFRRVLELDPENVGAHVAMTQLAKTQADDPHFAFLEKQLKDKPSILPAKRISLHFALGKCHEDMKDYDTAFSHFLQGNQLKRQRIAYDADQQQQSIESICSVFSQEFIDRHAGRGHESGLPIFVLGMPRSGTTLTETIIASHRDVYAAGELPDLLRLANEVTGGYPAGLQPENAATAIQTLGSRYLERVRTRAPDARRITDKMPANYLAVGLIHLALPNARIVHVKRNPVDTCLSAYCKLFNRSQLQSYDLSELGRYYRNYLRLMQHWRQVLPQNAFYEVEYEALVSNQEEETRRLLAFLGLDWDEACLTPHKTERNVKTASVTQVREPVYTSSVERWRRYEKHLGPLLDALGDAVSGRP